MTISIYFSLKVHFVKLQSPFPKTPKSNENLTQFLFSRLTCSQCDHNSNSSHTVKTHKTTQHELSKTKFLSSSHHPFLLCPGHLWQEHVLQVKYLGKGLLWTTRDWGWNMWRRRISGKVNHQDIDLDFSSVHDSRPVVRQPYTVWDNLDHNVILNTNPITRCQSREYLNLQL